MSVIAKSRIDAELKTKAEAVLAEMGLKPRGALELFYTAVIKQRKLPFAVGADSPEEQDELEAFDNKLSNYGSNRHVRLGDTVRIRNFGKGKTEAVIEAVDAKGIHLRVTRVPDSDLGPWKVGNRFTEKTASFLKIVSR